MVNTFEPATGKGSSVILGDGRRIPVRGSGIIKVSASTLGWPSSGTLRNVLYTPDMAVSLLSVPSLASAGLEVLIRDRAQPGFSGPRGTLPELLAIGTQDEGECWNIAVFRLRPDDCRDRERVAHVGADAAHPC